MIDVLKFDSSIHYMEVANWWTSQGWPMIPVESLPSRGYIARDEQGLLAATFLYVSDSNIGWMEWTVGNPCVSWERRAEGLNAVVDQVQIGAAALGMKTVFTAANHKRLIEKYINKGFKSTEDEMTHLIWEVM